MRALLILLGVISFAGMPYSVLMPVFAESILHGGAKGLGLLMGASGLGALGGALFAGWVAERVGAPATVAIGGIVCLAAAGVFSARLPALRPEARELIVAQEMAGAEPAAEAAGPGGQVLVSASRRS